MSRPWRWWWRHPRSWVRFLVLPNVYWIRHAFLKWFKINIKLKTEKTVRKYSSYLYFEPDFSRWWSARHVHAYKIWFLWLYKTMSKPVRNHTSRNLAAILFQCRCYESKLFHSTRNFFEEIEKIIKLKLDFI